MEHSGSGYRMNNVYLVRSALVAALGGLLFGFDTAVIAGATRALSQTYGLSAAMLGVTVSMALWGTVAGSLLASAPSDRYGRKIFIILGPVFGAIAVQITAMTTVLWLIVFARLLEGLSTGSSIPATLGYISEATVGRPNLRARVMGMFEITLVGGIAMGAVVGGVIGHEIEKKK